MVDGNKLLFCNGSAFQLLGDVYMPVTLPSDKRLSLVEMLSVGGDNLEDCFGLVSNTYRFLKEQVPLRAKEFLDTVHPDRDPLEISQNKAIPKIIEPFFNNRLPYSYVLTGDVLTVAYIHPYTTQVSTSSWVIRNIDGTLRHDTLYPIYFIENANFDKLIDTKEGFNPLYFQYLRNVKGNVFFNEAELILHFSNACKILGENATYEVEELIKAYRATVVAAAEEHLAAIKEE